MKRATWGTAILGAVALLVTSLGPVLLGCQDRRADSASAANSRAGEKPSRSPAATTPAARAAKNTVELKILNFGEIQKLIASHRGRVVVVDGWSTSCAPCVKDFHRLVALHRRFGPSELACISLCFDYEGVGDPAKLVPGVIKFLRRERATFDNVLASEGSDAMYGKLHLASVPAVWVYDRQGQLRKRFDNEKAHTPADAFTYDQIGRLVAELVARRATR